MQKFSTITAVVLCGGKSRRMGTDKAMIQFNGVTLLEHIVGLMLKQFTEVVVACGNEECYPGLPVRKVPDLLEGEGAIIGIHAGLSAAKTDKIFAIACDAPFPQNDLIRLVVESAKSAAWTVPRIKEGFEPLFSVYDKRCLPALEKIVTEKRRKMVLLSELVPTEFIEETLLRTIDPDLRSFINVNTPEDLKRIRCYLENNLLACS